MTSGAHVKCIAGQHGLPFRAGGKGIGRVEDRRVRGTADISGRCAIRLETGSNRRAPAWRGDEQRNVLAASTPDIDLSDERCLESRDRDRDLVTQPSARCGIVGAKAENDEVCIVKVSSAPSSLACLCRLAADPVATHCYTAGQCFLEHYTERRTTCTNPAACNMAVTDDCDDSTLTGASECLRQIGDG